MRIFVWTVGGLLLGLVIGAGLGFGVGYLIADATTQPGSKEMLGVGAVSGMFVGGLVGPVACGGMGLWLGIRSSKRSGAHDAEGCGCRPSVRA